MGYCEMEQTFRNRKEEGKEEGKETKRRKQEGQVPATRYKERD